VALKAASKFFKLLDADLLDIRFPDLCRHSTLRLPGVRGKDSEGSMEVMGARIGGTLTI
jgi:hypothetical protein